MYAKQGLTKEKGFGTSDWPKRDEFSHTIRMQQHREILRACVLFQQTGALVQTCGVVNTT